MGEGRVIMPRRQRSAYGCIERIDRDRYRVRWMGDAHDGRGRRRLSHTVHGSRVEAAEFLARMQLEHADDRPVPTVGQAYEAWVVPDYERMLAAYDDRGGPGRRGELLKPGTVRQLESCWRVHVAPRWSDVRVDEVRYADVQDWLDGLTEQTAQRGLAILRSVLRLCMLNDVVDRNVAEYSYRMPHRAARRGDGVWTLEELDERLWPALHGTCAEAAFMLAAFDGCRTGECLAPRLDEVRPLEAGGMTLAAVPVLRQVDASGAVSLDGDLKNVWSPRPTVVPEPWSLRLLQIRDRGEAQGLVWLSDDGLGTPSARGRSAGSSTRPSTGPASDASSSAPCAARGARGSPAWASRPRSSRR